MIDLHDGPTPNGWELSIADKAIWPRIVTWRQQGTERDRFDEEACQHLFGGHSEA